MRLILAFVVFAALLFTAAVWPGEGCQCDPCHCKACPRDCFGPVSAERAITYIRIFCGQACPPCKQMREAIKASPALGTRIYKSGLTVWDLEFENEKHKPLFIASGVDRFPTIILYDQGETEIDRLVGFPESGGEERLLKFLKRK